MCGSGCGIAQLRQSYQQEHRFVDPVDQVAWRSCFSRLLKMVLQELERHDVVFFAPHPYTWPVLVNFSQVLEKGALLALGPHLTFVVICCKFDPAF